MGWNGSNDGVKLQTRRKFVEKNEESAGFLNES